ncbi:hypothetical protein CN198_13965 [Sinorhizobium meliloti]|uniref:hypothetical protein n=1 Tax=Rhizobium meliloti TaxID=382 RepID=UPI000FDB07E3|nr:hypothetical protein [Sinorhizobium meliloti]RVH69168.1 hypothetical protein CN198_13965 [Sinorhizobium meliloti]
MQGRRARIRYLGSAFYAVFFLTGSATLSSAQSPTIPDVMKALCGLNLGSGFVVPCFQSSSLFNRGSSPEERKFVMTRLACGTELLFMQAPSIPQLVLKPNERLIEEKQFDRYQFLLPANSLDFTLKKVRSDKDQVRYNRDYERLSKSWLYNFTINTYSSEQLNCYVYQLTRLLSEQDVLIGALMKRINKFESANVDRLLNDNLALAAELDGVKTRLNALEKVGAK